MNRRNKISLSLCVVAAGIALMGKPVYSTWRENTAKRYQALSIVHAREISWALFEYQKEHGDRLPAARRWETEVRPYAGVDDETWEALMTPFTFPGQPKRRFVMNAALSGKRMTNVRDADHMVLIYEGEGATGKNASNDLSSFPPCSEDACTIAVVAYASGWVESVPCHSPFADRSAVIRRSREASGRK